MATKDHLSDADQTDHHIPYKHEIHVTVSDNDNTKMDAITPTASPRSNKSNMTSEVASTHSDEVLTRKVMSNKQPPNGLDNLAFEKDRSGARPLSSFGNNNGMTEVNLKETTNGKTADKPLGRQNSHCILS